MVIEGIRRVTRNQFVSLLIELIWVLAIFPFVVTQILQKIGLLGWIDSLYSDRLVFWLTLALSRAIIGVLGWIAIDWTTHIAIEKRWLRFEREERWFVIPESWPSWEDIVYWATYLLIMTSVCEVALRVYSGDIPPFYLSIR